MENHELENIQSIPEFCDDAGISKAFFYKLRNAGKAPRVTKLGSRSIITPNARREWLAVLDKQEGAQ